ncbi:MAG: hypothetical protein KAS71_19195, partial [Bacteroidales bacterium]|nr:hypothetical protein [Bacteroidales bacterium]
LITGKVDFMSQALVCLSFQNLKSSLENQYKEMAEIIFESILDDMEKPDISNRHQYSFRMYYYLFEYLKCV